jgi:hypothetical protein
MPIPIPYEYLVLSARQKEGLQNFYSIADYLELRAFAEYLF